MEEGFRGRIGLHALPQAETFYARNCGMTDLGNDMRKEGLRIFRDDARTGSRVPSVRRQWNSVSTRSGLRDTQTAAGLARATAVIGLVMDASRNKVSVR
jgi:hypothetical protein